MDTVTYHYVGYNGLLNLHPKNKMYLRYDGSTIDSGLAVTPSGEVYGKRGKRKASLSDKGYLYVKSSGVRFSVHRLVMSQHRPRANWAGLEIGHINGLKTDNRVENLEWCTAQQNRGHAVKIGLVRLRTPEQIAAKERREEEYRMELALRQEQKNMAYSLREDGRSHRDIARTLGRSRSFAVVATKDLPVPDGLLKRYSPDDLKKMWDMRNRGDSYREIGVEFSIKYWKQIVKKQMKRAIKLYGPIAPPKSRTVFVPDYDNEESIF
jgi:hypothetical protein